MNAAPTLQRRRLLIRQHDGNLADTLIGLPPKRGALKSCPAWQDGDGAHFWQRFSARRISEHDRCWWCRQTRGASRHPLDYEPPTGSDAHLERALRTGE